MLRSPMKMNPRAEIEAVRTITTAGNGSGQKQACNTAAEEANNQEKSLLATISDVREAIWVGRRTCMYCSENQRYVPNTD